MSEGCRHFTEAMCVNPSLHGGLVAVPRLNSLDAGLVAKVLSFCCTCLKMQEVIPNYKGLGVDSLVPEHSQLHKAPSGSYSARERVNPYTSCPCHTDVILSAKEQIVRKPEKEIAQRKQFSQKKLKK